MKNYRIMRFYEDGRNARVMRTGLNEEQAREWCEDEETSSSTAENGRNGCSCEWFDGFERD